jgi:hypothetical protein
VADYVGDGNAELLWRSSTNSIGIWLMNGTTVLQSSAIGNVGTAQMAERAAVGGRGFAAMGMLWWIERR